MCCCSSEICCAFSRFYVRVSIFDSICHMLFRFFIDLHLENKNANQIENALHGTLILNFENWTQPNSTWKCFLFGHFKFIWILQRIQNERETKHHGNGWEQSKANQVNRVNQSIDASDTRNQLTD